MERSCSLKSKLTKMSTNGKCLEARFQFVNYIVRIKNMKMIESREELLACVRQAIINTF